MQAERVSIVRQSRILFFAMIGMMLHAPAIADDKELYDPAPPADAAFVRLVNISDKTINGLVGELNFKELAAKSAAPYRVLEAGDYDMSIGKIKEPFSVSAGNYYTFVYDKTEEKDKKDGAQRLLKFEDAPVADPAKSMVYFYNMADKEAGLRAPNFNTTIIPSVLPAEMQARELNALTIDAALNIDNVDVKNFTGVALKRRRGYSFFLSGKEPRYDGFYVLNTQGKKAP